MRKILLGLAFVSFHLPCYCWGFFAHQQINFYAVFLLPPDMLVFFKPHIAFLSEHAVDPDKRRYAVKEEAPRHYIDIDRYGSYPFPLLPRQWKEAVACYGEDTLQANGIVPWHVQRMMYRLTEAFREKQAGKILRTAAEIGHYIADAHVPLHANSNHNGQFTNQRGIHGFWESRVPELLADNSFDFFIGHAHYIGDPGHYIWDRVLESAKAADSVLTFEKLLTGQFPTDQKFAFENRNGVLTRQYSAPFTITYNRKLQGMVERRMRLAVFSVASFWYTAWVNAGQPDLRTLVDQPVSETDQQEMELLNAQWKAGSTMLGREE